MVWNLRSERVFVIGEIGVNHNGSVDMARRLVDAAAEAGADAVKFQTFRAEEVLTPQAEMADYQSQNLGKSGTQLDMVRQLELSPDDFHCLKGHCDAAGIAFLSTPFDEGSADLLAELDVGAFKVSSGDLTHLGFLAKLAGFGKPIILSTGMGNLGEIEEALEAIEAAGDPEVALLHCVSDYPARVEDCNLRAMATMERAFGLPVGWSDHTLGDAVTLAAVALGARIIEKHFTLDRDLPGPDHKASMLVEELATMIERIRDVEKALGSGRKRPTEREASTARVARRSIVAGQDIPAGTRLSAEMLAVRRPGSGLRPRHLNDLVGMVAQRDLPQNSLLSFRDLAGAPTGRP